MDQLLLTTMDVARLLKVDPSTVALWANQGKLPAFRTPGGHRRIRREDLLDFLRSRQMPIPTELREPSLRIVLVDQDSKHRSVLERELRAKAKGLEVRSTASGLEGLLLVAESRPDALVLDLERTDLDAFALCRLLKSRTDYSEVRLIFFTGEHSPELVARSLGAGAVGCLPKPLRGIDVLHLLRVPVDG